MLRVRKLSRLDLEITNERSTRKSVALIASLGGCVVGGRGLSCGLAFRYDDWGRAPSLLTTTATSSSFLQSPSLCFRRPLGRQITTVSVQSARHHGLSQSVYKWSIDQEQLPEGRRRASTFRTRCSISNIRTMGSLYGTGSSRQRFPR